MPIVTGVLADFGRLPLIAARAARIDFKPSGPAVKSFGSVIYASRTISVNPSAANGTWSVDLEQTNELMPETWYVPSVTWLDEAGNFTSVDYPSWRLYVPGSGGAFVDLISTPWNPTLAWWGSDEPPGVPVVNTLWLDPDTGILSIRSN